MSKEVLTVYSEDEFLRFLDAAEVGVTIKKLEVVSTTLQDVIYFECTNPDGSASDRCLVIG